MSLSHESYMIELKILGSFITASATILVALATYVNLHPNGATHLRPNGAT